MPSQVFTPAGPGPAGQVAQAVRLALSGGTVHLGRLLAPAGVRYVVVVDAVAPSMAGTVTPSVSAPPPAGLQTDLLEQDDLQMVPGLMGVQVYENSEDMPVTGAAHRAAPRRDGVDLPGRSGRRGVATGAGRPVAGSIGVRPGRCRHRLRRLRAGGEFHP